MRTPLANMLEQAYELGVSNDRCISSLAPLEAPLLEDEWNKLLSENPDFNDGSFDEDLGMTDIETVDFRQLVIDGLGSLACEAMWQHAAVGKSYHRLYEAGSEGTDYHNDADTYYDLIVVHTRSGRADFGAIDTAGRNFVTNTTPGSVIAFRADVTHFAGPPLGGLAREIEGVPIRIDGDLDLCWRMILP